MLAKLGLDEDPAAQQPPTLKSTPNSGTGVSQTLQDKSTLYSLYNDMLYFSDEPEKPTEPTLPDIGGATASPAWY